MEIPNSSFLIPHSDISVRISVSRRNLMNSSGYRSSNTLSVGLPRTARSPEMATGLSIKRGCSTIAAMSWSRESDSSFKPSSRYSFSLLRIRSRGPMPSIRSTLSSSAALGGSFRYSTITGSTPCSRSRLTACLDLFQRGLCQTMMPIEQLLLTRDHNGSATESKQNSIRN